MRQTERPDCAGDRGRHRWDYIGTWGGWGASVVVTHRCRHCRVERITAVDPLDRPKYEVTYSLPCEE